MTAQELPMTAFDPAGPLPTSTVVLQASAGTGKTHAIAALATRYLAEGELAIEHLAVISFSRVASEELRSRVRKRLRDTAELLDAALAGNAPPAEPDATDSLLLSGDAGQLQARRDRLRAALTGLDSAVIMTIHQFCQAMFDELGVLAAEDPQAKLVEDLGQLLEQVVTDRYLARYATATDRPFDLAAARRLGIAAAIELPETPLVPAIASGLPAERLAFAEEVRTELARRKQRLGLFSYDDQLSRLRDSLKGPAGQAGAERLRRRCQVVLVDEFQDTDPVQWEILRDTFAGQVPLVLIGDPKQAIYAFRGADVTAYSQAVAASRDRYSLAVNHRADEPVVAAIGALFAGVPLGRDVLVEPVVASHRGSRLTGNAPPPVRLRCVATDRLLDAATARAKVDADVVAEVVRLLDGGTELIEGTSTRRLAEQDIAVLVNTNKRGRDLAEALAAAGVAVAFSGSDSILASPAAQDWFTLLRALEQPRRAAVREAILTDFVGADLTALATADDDRLTGWSGLLQRWGRLLTNQGVAALFAAVQADSPEVGGGLSERLLRRRRGERDLTDHRQLAEILHAQYTAGVRGPALVAWLAEQIELQSGAGDRTRRLETDRQAVQLMTVHKAKGLQFPVVLLPQAGDLYLSEEDSGGKLDFHDDSGQRVLDLGGKDAPGRRQRWELDALEQAEDRFRGLYVATTRAMSQLTMWWAPTLRTTESSPLHRLLYRNPNAAGTPAAAYPLDAGAGWVSPSELGWLSAAGITVEQCDAAPVRLAPRADESTQLVAPTWQRRIDQYWRRTSYSGLTEAVHARAPGAPAAPEFGSDEPVAEGTLAQDGDALGARSPMADLPGGTSFGSLVHEVLENLDWHAPSTEALDERLLAATTAAARRFAIGGVAPQALAEALRPSLLTPLGPLTDGLSLADFDITDRLSELDFELPLGHAGSTTTLGEVATLLRRRLPTGDPLIDYPDDLAAEPLASQLLRGFLTGSIDSVLRVSGEAGPRFVVLDYKTNRLGPTDLRLGHYSTAAMTAEMRRTHYPLQALLYCVALHRFLGSRLHDYEPSRHLGGVGYLFVRGMGGELAGPETGVFAWHPSAELVVELSALLADRGAND
ncbi:UvrD-helicase domain-containing protein [Propionicimonas sp.]|uniref:UvrD-helicase domain-containing protein n=1 Tax=Propionicimonas sp. TaxID=1955623 RepID=UPI00183C557E|nr:UvrD-helicase domain-containing protein [Propionicimonas sp.]MBU3977521.1 UvrD-helicase domain-containing protein [Actinomycetota bacterium]MBA3021446.1 AAA family ATPase [Propionicimonas sp.]MBU3986031.1 UvrD-helicase domain-containing protein [Actinomycetota bacterium]MBU4008816.1 UvrD-helicase domain-containing protein [Actinomycetota bacterium]MBU4066034.1 UvrD-helicase domain-containing protein [Actinomycetota bacterium]